MATRDVSSAAGAAGPSAQSVPPGVTEPSAHDEDGSVRSKHSLARGRGVVRHM
jgi:hypothetical protein